jgi:hypothetical protein
MKFKNWTSSPAVTFANANSAATTFTMPTNAVTVTAVFEAATAISIDTQPASVTVVEGKIEGSLTVAASAPAGTVLSYQWYASTTGNVADGVAIEGATGASFTIPTGLTAGTYYYYCVISAAGATSVTSTVATVTVTNVPAPPVPVFDGLANTYTAGSAAVTLKVIGLGSEQLTVFKVNGTAATQFNPTTAGVYLIEAASANGNLRIWKYVQVN